MKLKTDKTNSGRTGKYELRVMGKPSPWSCFRIKSTCYNMTYVRLLDPHYSYDLII